MISEPKSILKHLDGKYSNPHLRLHLEEQGWKYLGKEDGKALFKIFY